MAVSFFVIDQNGFEVQIGACAMTTIQDNGLTQVALTALAPGYEEIVEKLANNEKGTPETVRVKPFVSGSQISFLQTG
jgi:hypothetical protein